MKKLKNNSIIRFIVVLFLFGLCIGIVSYYSNKLDLSNYLLEFKNYVVNNHNNVFLLDIIVISSIFLLSLIVVGYPLVLTYVIYEGLSFGYTLCVFFNYYGFKGILFYFLFYLLIKLVFIIVILYQAYIGFKYARIVVKAIIDKNINSIYKSLFMHFIRYLIVLVIVIINSALIYFLSNKIISLFISLI